MLDAVLLAYDLQPSLSKLLIVLLALDVELGHDSHVLAMPLAIETMVLRFDLLILRLLGQGG